MPRRPLRRPDEFSTFPYTRNPLDPTTLTLQQIIQKRRRPPLGSAMSDELAQPAEKLYEERELHTSDPLERSRQGLGG